MNEMSVAFVAALLLKLFTEFYLSWRQARAVRAHRGEVPVAFRERIDLAAHQKAADYTLARIRVGNLTDIVETVLLLTWTLAGGVWMIDDIWRDRLPDAPLWRGIGVIFTLGVASYLLELPLSLYRTFVLEARFGFNKTTWRIFLADTVKGTLLSVVIGTPILAGVIALMERAGDLWWLYAWLGWSAFSFLMLWLYPTLIAPLFNKFTPLTDEVVLTRVRALLDRCGFASQGVFVMDGSLRSSHGNAYFTGLGRNKRVVFFDTLLTTLDIEEVEGVLAHELGHFKLNHVKRRIGMSLVTTLASLALLGWVGRQPWFYAGLGGIQPSTYGALLLFFLVAPTFSFFLHPLSSWMSRRDEYAADDFAAQHVDPRHLAHGLVKLYRDNASTLTPDPLHSTFYDSHPPAPLRIAHLEAISRSSETRPAP